MSETAIQSSHVVRSFGPVRALNDVSFAVVRVSPALDV
jgi:ABC-type branched-subunit amino acid transport system ATPase component